jgi:hypothetical protein
MVVVSVTVHIIVAVLVVSAGWLPGKTARAPRTVMTISLGGGGGPSSGGATAMTSRPVQVQAPQFLAACDPGHKDTRNDHSEKRGETKNTPTQVVAQAPDEARGKTPTKGAKTSAGNAVAETSVPRGQGFGLSTRVRGSGQRSTSLTSLPSASRRCCSAPRHLESGSESGRRMHHQVHQRDGRITDHEVERSSDPLLDSAARRAVASTQQLAAAEPVPNPTPSP